jgi:hypothetical protein
VLYDAVKAFIEAENWFKLPICASDPVMSPISTPLSVNEPVTLALCINISYYYLI